MKVTVSLPDHLVDSVDEAAKKSGSNRSAVLAGLLRDWHARRLTERINAHLSEHPLSCDESFLEEALGETVGEVLD